MGMLRSQKEEPRIKAVVYLTKPAYNAGHRVGGYVECDVERPIKGIKNIVIILKGQVECTNIKAKEKAVQAKEIFDFVPIHHDQKVLKEFPKNYWEVVGKEQFEFEFLLPGHLPSTSKTEAHTDVDDAYAEVVYGVHLRVTMKNGKQFPLPTNGNFEVVAVPPDNIQEDISSHSLQIKELKLKNLGVVHCKVNLLNAYPANTLSSIILEALNDSKTDVKAIEIGFYEMVDITIKGKKRAQERCYFKESFTGVASGEVFGYMNDKNPPREEEFRTADSCPDISVKKCVHVRHYVTIKFVMNNSVANHPTVKLPVTIYYEPVEN